MVREVHKDAVKEVTASVLPIWLDTFKAILSVDPLSDVNGQYWDGLALKREVIKARTTRCFWGWRRLSLLADAGHHPHFIPAIPASLYSRLPVHRSGPSERLVPDVLSLLCDWRRKHPEYLGGRQGRALTTCRRCTRLHRRRPSSIKVEEMVHAGAPARIGQCRRPMGGNHERRRKSRYRAGNEEAADRSYRCRL